MNARKPKKFATFDAGSAVTNRPAGAADAHNDLEQLLVLTPKKLKVSLSPVVIVAEQDNEGPPMKKRAKCIDMEKIIMGEELCDNEINYAQYLLKEQFGEVNGLVSTKQKFSID